MRCILKFCRQPRTESPGRFLIVPNGTKDRISTILLILCLQFGVRGISSAAETSAPPPNIHVSPEGDDANPGTTDAPVRTIAGSQQLVRKARKAGQSGNLTVAIHGGEYFLDQPLQFDIEDSAPTGSTTTYAAMPGERVLVSGGQRIEGWRREGSAMVTTIAAVREGKWFFRELFVNDQRAVRARAPNQGFYRVSAPGPDRRTSFQFRTEDAVPNLSTENAEVVFFHDWSTSQVRVKSIVGTQRTIFLAAPIGRAMPHYEIGHFQPHPRYYLENAPELLDQPGEWYLDRTTGNLSYFPRAGEELESLVATAPRLGSLLTVRGNRSDCRRVIGLEFKGITFSHCSWEIPSEGLAMGQASLYEDRTRAKSSKSPQAFLPAAVSFDLAERCVVENCRFEHLGASALQFRETCLHNRVEGNLFTDVGANGIDIGESATRPLNRRCRSSLSAPNAVSRGNVVRNNVVEKCGALYPSGVGIWVAIAAETVIENNTLRQLPYAGISIGWSWKDGATGCRDNRVRGNHIHHVMQVLSDAGAIYTLGNQPGTVIANNRIHHIPPNVGRAESNGIFFDEASAFLQVVGNEISDVARSPMRFHNAHDISLQENKLECPPDIAPWKFQGCRQSMMEFIDNKILSQ